ncbi:MAG: hypothetical protein BGO43_06055 [Gammaproteobacteria bacterium 39-13]|nr:hypothetical protein [Gammaproteobacteria bacterium]OJV90416.1 MAG: hypothetical protein BGO43_06055 [Gammaproteobacteria bacterium 39-13]
MQYKGFIARHYFVIDAGVYVGEIVNTSDVIAFSAESLAHLHEAMKSAVDSYLNFLGIDPFLSCDKQEFRAYLP